MLKVLKGMKDVLPAESARWRALEREMRKAALTAGYREIRTPVLEHTELFARSAGESSDVVRKEMYTFLDKGDRSVTLKPESTAGTVRAFLESGLYAQALPLKMYYVNAPHFRYEAPPVRSAARASPVRHGVLRRGRTLRGCGADLAGGQASVRFRAEKPVRAHQLTLDRVLPRLPEGVPRIPRARRTACAAPARSAWKSTPCARWTARRKAASGRWPMPP